MSTGIEEVKQPPPTEQQLNEAHIARILNSRLYKAVQQRNKVAAQEALDSSYKGSDPCFSTDATHEAFHCSIMSSQYDIAAIILSHFSTFRDIIMQHTPLDVDCTTIVLEYFGNVHDLIRVGWGKICQLGWTNSMWDLKLMQLCIFHGPRSLVNVTSPDFHEHCLVSAVKNNCQLFIKIVLCIYREQLGGELYHSIVSGINHDLKYHIDRVANAERKTQILQIFERYHHDFEALQFDVFAMILADQFGKYRVLQTYIKEKAHLYPILNDLKFQQEVEQRRKESAKLVKEYKAKVKSEREAIEKKARQDPNLDYVIDEEEKNLLEKAVETVQSISCKVM